MIWVMLGFAVCLLLLFKWINHIVMESIDISLAKMIDDTTDSIVASSETVKDASKDQISTQIQD